MALWWGTTWELLVLLAGIGVGLCCCLEAWGQWWILPTLVVIPMVGLRPSQVECLQAIQTIAVESHKKVKKSRAICDSKRRPCMNLRKLGMLDKQGLRVQKVQPLWLEKYKPSFFLGRLVLDELVSEPKWARIAQSALVIKGPVLGFLGAKLARFSRLGCFAVSWRTVQLIYKWNSMLKKIPCKLESFIISNKEMN